MLTGQNNSRIPVQISVPEMQLPVKTVYMITDEGKVSLHLCFCPFQPLFSVYSYFCYILLIFPLCFFLLHASNFTRYYSLMLITPFVSGSMAEMLISPSFYENALENRAEHERRGSELKERQIVREKVEEDKDCCFDKCEKSELI